MNRQLLSLLFLLLTIQSLWAQVQYTTANPRVDDVNDRDVMIKRVELTKEYTILYMKFESPARSRDKGSNISFQPSSRLYVNQGERSYKLIRAENIPADIYREVDPGERVDFVAYFERIAPGYTVFDLFECKDYVTRASQITCFNFWGVHITNPIRKPYAQRTPPKPNPSVLSKPRYTPRITPGAGKPAESAPDEKPKPEVAVIPVPPTNVAITGITRDAKTNGSVQAIITYRLLSGAEATADGSVDSVRSDEPTGKYTIPVDRRGVYAVAASAKGYFSQSDTLATNRVGVVRDFNLVPIEAGAKITLRNSYFSVSKFDLKPESFPELDRLAGVMRDNPTMTVRLEGHTDTVGDFDANVELSRNRVDEVKRYLVSKGISAGRIETAGYGPSRPINTNKSLKERPENRRVEMVVVNV